MLLVERLGLSPSWARAVGHCPLLSASFWCVPGCSRVFPLFFVPASCSCPSVPFTSVPPELQDPLNYFSRVLSYKGDISDICCSSVGQAAWFC